MSILKTYYSLTKPGIIYGNSLTAFAGFLLGSRGDIQIGRLLATVAGTALVIAAGCVFNNYIDRGIDRKMARTKKRALVSGKISGRHALFFGAVLGMLGFTVLALWVNALVVMIGIVGFVDYVALYGWAKRHSVYGTLVGSVSGATPVVAGYCAATGRFDMGALLLFMILALWQLPHFYAIATYRHDDYTAAALPVLPVKANSRVTKWNIVLYVLAFIAAAASLTLYGYAGYTYLVVMLVMGLLWLRLTLRGFRASDDAKWARSVFGFSLLVILAFSLMLSLDAWLP